MKAIELTLFVSGGHRHHPRMFFKIFWGFARFTFWILAGALWIFFLCKRQRACTLKRALGRRFCRKWAKEGFWWVLSFFGAAEWLRQKGPGTGRGPIFSDRNGVLESPEAKRRSAAEQGAMDIPNAW